MKALFYLLVVGLLVATAGCADQAPSPEATPTPVPVDTTAPVASPSPTGDDGGDETPTADTTTQETPGAAEVAWAPDGVISEGEYAANLELGGGMYTVYWTNDAEDLFMALRGEVTGWMAIGFEPTTAMKDADMVFGWVENGEATMEDMFSTGQFGPHPPDLEQGGTYDILESGGMEEDGVTVIEFRRSMDTGDVFDKAFTSGQTVSIIWGLADTDGPSFKHNVGKGSGQISLL